MWSIEVSEDASEEEVIQAVLDEEIKINIEDKDFDVLSSISLKESVELVSKWLEEDEASE
jgi:hypothetical protein